MGEGAALGHCAEGLTGVQVPEGPVEQDLLLAPQGHVAQPAPVPGLPLAHKVPLQHCPWWAGRGSSWRGHGRQAQERRCARSPATSLHRELGELNHSREALPI